MKHELVVHLLWKLNGCVFEPWPTQNNFLFAKIIFGMNVNGQKPSCLGGTQEALKSFTCEY